jgi:hypothetical protein
MNEMIGVKRRVSEVEDRLVILEKVTCVRGVNGGKKTVNMEEDNDSTTCSDDQATENEKMDLAQKQLGITDQLNKMEDLMNNTIAAVNLLHNTQDMTTQRHTAHPKNLLHQ